MKNAFLLCLFLLMAAVCPASSDTLESLDKDLYAVEQRQVNIARTYAQERAKNEDRQQRIKSGKGSNADVQEAYAAAATLESLNAQINGLNEQHQQLCLRWRAVYRSSMDALLAQAEQEKEPKKKADIGKQLQSWQKRNDELCAEVMPAATLEWKSLSIEPYDGPVEIEQKAQLLKDISREMTLRLSRLDEQFQQAQREYRTRERAREFIQEGTLFDQSISLRNPSSVEGTDRGGSGTFSTGNEVSNSSSASPDSVTLSNSAGTDWQPGTDPKKMKDEYSRRREDLKKQQKELQSRIREFEEKQKALLKP